MKLHRINSVAHCGHCATAPQAVITWGAASCLCCPHLQGWVQGTGKGQTFSWCKMAEPHRIPWDFIDLEQLKLWPLLCLKSETGFHWTQKNTLWDTLKPVLCTSKELNDSQDFLWDMYKHTLCTACEQASPDTQTQNTLPAMCQGEEEFSKSLHFYWKLCASPPTYNALCTPRNQHCLNLWYFNKPSCQAKDDLRHITFVQRRIPAPAKSRECELCYRPTHRYVKWVLLKITALRTAWSGRGHRLFRGCTWEWQIATKNPFTVHRGKWGSTNECLFFIS